MWISDNMQTTFFYIERFLKKLKPINALLSLKGLSTIWNIMYIQYITMIVDWPEIGRKIKVSIMFNISHTVFLRSTAEQCWWTQAICSFLDTAFEAEVSFTFFSTKTQSLLFWFKKPRYLCLDTIDIRV